MKKLTTWVVTKETAETIRGPLNWLKEQHPHKPVRVDAANLLRKIRFEGDTKQLVLTKREKETLSALYQAFPEACTPPRQLKFEIPEGRPTMDYRNRVDRQAINLETRYAANREGTERDWDGNRED